MVRQVVIIQEVSSTEIIVKCARCNGYGTLGDKFNDPECPTCSGKGKVLVEVERLPLVECSRCNGYGTLGQRYNDPVCTSCSGVGCQPIAGRWRIIK